MGRKDAPTSTAVAYILLLIAGISTVVLVKGQQNVQTGCSSNISSNAKDTMIMVMFCFVPLKGFMTTAVVVFSFCIITAWDLLNGVRPKWS